MSSNPLFLAQPLSARIAEQERNILASKQLKTELDRTSERETQLELAFQQREIEIKLAFRQREAELELASRQREIQLEGQLERITNSLGWRLLNNYGPIKYRFVLPAYKRIKKILRAKTANAE